MEKNNTYMSWARNTQHSFAALRLAEMECWSKMKVRELQQEPIRTHSEALHINTHDGCSPVQTYMLHVWHNVPTFGSHLLGICLENKLPYMEHIIYRKGSRNLASWNYLKLLSTSIRFVPVVLRIQQNLLFQVAADLPWSCFGMLSLAICKM